MTQGSLKQWYALTALSGDGRVGCTRWGRPDVLLPQMERLGSSDWWVALAARRALQAMLLHVSPTALALSRAAYQHMLDACYRSLLSAAASSGEGKSTASARLCTELMQSWRRRHEQQGKWVPCYTVGLRLLQSLMNALDALTAPSPSVDQGVHTALPTRLAFCRL